MRLESASHTAVCIHARDAAPAVLTNHKSALSIESVSIRKVAWTPKRCDRARGFVPLQREIVWNVGEYDTAGLVAGAFAARRSLQRGQRGKMSKQAHEI